MGWWQGVLNLVMPRFCLECGQAGSLLCEGCWQKVAFVYEQGCPVCYEGSIGGLTHPRCKSAWGLDGLWCVVYYRGPARRLVRQLKYHQATVVAELVGGLVAEYLHHEQIYVPPGMLVPVPLSRSSEIKRGFNQAALIGQEFGNVLNLPLVEGLIERIKEVPSQTRLSKEERRANVRGIFAIDLPKERMVEVVKGRTFIVVDDVFTSGATMSEVAKVLKRAGAARVYGLALARD